MKLSLCTLLFAFLSFSLYAQKTVFKPAEWSRAGTPYYGLLSDTRSYQSKNFVIFWGDAVGNDPTTASPADRRFNPQAVCDTLEFIYKRLVTELQFCSDAPTTNLGKYKIIIVMLGTFGPNGPQGFAFGGAYEGTIGAMWVDPNAVKDGGALSHELTHSLQTMINIQENPNPGGGYVGYGPAGFFYEGHANYMRSLVYPKMAITDIPRWFGTRHFHWSSTRHHYANYRLLYHIGYAMTTRLWKESLRNEHPLVTLRRLKNYTQAQLNDYIYEFARREPTLDYPMDKDGNFSNAPASYGAILRNEENRIKNREPHYQWKKYTILTKVAGSPDRYIIPDDWAPQDYGFNIIPLYPTCTTETKAVTVKFKGHTEVNATAGWRYGFVTAKSDGTISRYSPTYTSNEAEINFDLKPGETQMYLVVMGAPTSHTSYAWEPGWPKIKRYPYELRIANALPEGYQNNFRAAYKTNGRVHPNGGGWVTNGTTIASTVYVGPNAIVRGGNYSGSVRIEGTAWVEGATMRDNVIVKDNAMVRRGTYSGNALVQNNAVLYDCTVSGTAIVKGNALEFGVTLGNAVIVGGDAEIGSCSTNGVYLQFPHGNNGRRECDGKGAADPSNVDVNQTITLFSNPQMDFSTNIACEPVPICTANVTPGGPTAFCSGGSVLLTATAGNAYVWKNGTLQVGSSQTYSATQSGSYTVQVVNAAGCVATSQAIQVTVSPIPSAPTVITPVIYCQNATATALTATGSSLKWYTVSTEGTASSTAPVPGTLIAGSDTHYVSQTVNACESPRSTIVVTVNSSPQAPAVSSPVTYTQGDAATQLNASGTYLKWYTNSSGGTGSLTAPTPSTSTVGNTTYYVSQTISNCESNRASIVVTINASNQAPVISITSPDDNTSFTGPVSITINANAHDSDGIITNVQFYNGAALLGSDATAPYSFVWNDAAAGSYTITAKATDNLSLTTVSSAISIKVNPAPAGFTLQAEAACAINGILNESTNAGFRGTGYANTDNALGTAASYVINSPVSQVVILTIRYANASTISRDMFISINDIAQAGSVTFPSTGGWTSWNTSTATIELVSGVNHVRLTSMNREGGPNLDELFFNATNLSEGDCSVILSTYGQNSASAAQAIVSPNPTKAAFSLWVPEYVKSISVIDIHGVEVYLHESIQDEGSVQFGDQLKPGVYHVKIFYKSGKVEVKKIQKIQ